MAIPQAAFIIRTGLTVVMLLCVGLTNIRANFSFNVHNKKAFEEILKLKINEGERHLAQSKSYGQNGLDIYLENYIEVIRLIAAEDIELYKKYTHNEKIRLHMLEQLDKSSPYYLLTQAEIRLQWAVVYYKMGHYTDCFIRVRKAYKLITENVKKHPDFLPNKKTFGVYKILFSLVPEKFYGFLDIMGFDPTIADLQQGLDDLDAVAGADTPFALEASIVKGGVIAYIMHDHASAHHTLYNLYQKHPDNYAFYTGSLLTAMNARMGKKALMMLEELPEDFYFQNNTFYDYLKAKVNMQVGNYGKAIYYAKKYVNRPDRVNYIKDSYLIIFLSHWFMGQDDLASSYLDKIKENGRSSTSADNYALEFANYKHLPDKELTRARFLSDAGEYQKALTILNNKKLDAYTRQEDKAEFCYRTARVYHHQEDYESAKEYYLKTIKISVGLKRYFAPKSALFLGHIYHEKFKDEENARVYYLKVLTYKKTEYKTELEISAKAGLKKLSSK